jgi:hypothetical protein
MRKCRSLSSSWKLGIPTFKTRKNKIIKSQDSIFAEICSHKKYIVSKSIEGTMGWVCEKLARQHGYTRYFSSMGIFLIETSNIFWKISRQLAAENDLQRDHGVPMKVATCLDVQDLQRHSLLKRS